VIRFLTLVGLLAGAVVAGVVIALIATEIIEMMFP